MYCDLVELVIFILFFNKYLNLFLKKIVIHKIFIKIKSGVKDSDILLIIKINLPCTSETDCVVDGLWIKDGWCIFKVCHANDVSLD